MPGFVGGKNHVPLVRDQQSLQIMSNKENKAFTLSPLAGQPVPKEMLVASIRVRPH